jgi:hypothetical protein
MKREEVLGIIERFNERIVANPKYNNEPYLRGFRNKVVQLWETKNVSYEEMNILTQLVDEQLFKLNGRV